MTNIVHVLPVSDRIDHDSDHPTGCACHPHVAYAGYGGFVVSHNAVDKRELRERKACFAFSLARHDITERPTSTTDLSDEAALALVDTLATRLRSSVADLDIWDRYYRGTQPLQFLHPEVALIVGDRLKNLVVNWPRLVLDSLEERLDVTGFRLPGADAPDRDIWGIWQANDFDLGSGRCHLAAMRHGRAFVTGWTNDDGSPRLAVETARQMTVDYEPGTTVVRSALKSWKDGKVTYANLYLPDRIVKYRRGGDTAPSAVTTSSTWQEYARLENPLGVVPVVPFLNRYDLDMPDGESELADVVHLADAINKLATDMMVSSEFHAMPRRWATGIEIPAAGPEKQRTEAEAKKYWDNATAGRTWLAGKGVQFGQFASADLKNFVDAIGMLTTKVAAIAGLPPHYLGIQGDNPASADAIRSAEASLIKRAERKMRTFGESWEDVITLALWARDGAQPDISELETVWRDAQTPTVAQRADAAVKLTSGGVIDAEQAQEDLGYSPVQIERMNKRRVRAVAAQATAEMSARVQQALDLITTYGIDEKIAFAAVGLVVPPKGTAAGPEALPPPAGDPMVTPADTSKGQPTE